ncbi:hypothetical protein SP19_118 [Salmonella phage 19]|nr:hypothetical protein SP19_118 [Salmonella phage 19]
MFESGAVVPVNSGNVPSLDGEAIESYNQNLIDILYDYELLRRAEHIPG